MKACPSVPSALKNLEAACDKTPQLRVVFPEGTAVSRVGIKLPKLAAKDTPCLSLSSSLVKLHDGDKYIAVCLDLDAPFPSFSVLGPIAHWIQTDLVPVEESVEDGFTKLETDARPVMPYIGPGPPSPSAPHRYVFLLWKQPASVGSVDEVSAIFSLPAEPGLTARIRWNQSLFEKQMGLGEPLAVNYFVADST
ncbi:Carboxypeptidase Y inhibitor [Beauveria bassiana D1-5]|uniref:Carboxypeptidase Y inhibitor n=1 Tax=Beauveria bassiana D1-5 TaxID=1245745 RepID=A0A0A2WBQ2_BEABA|nr:Carboxypeptidase Y inhibitor [Beauveria bassiana D1-5]